MLESVRRLIPVLFLSYFLVEIFLIFYIYSVFCLTVVRMEYFSTHFSVFYIGETSEAVFYAENQLFLNTCLTNGRSALGWGSLLGRG